LCIVQRSEDANLQMLIDELIEGLDVKNPLVLKSPLFHVSSTLIRESMVTGQAISDYVPKQVEEYILSHNLYVQS
jgi:nicotinic acid mononucleotide adenylyltransferase